MLRHLCATAAEIPRLAEMNRDVGCGLCGRNPQGVADPRDGSRIQILQRLKITPADYFPRGQPSNHGNDG